MLQLNKSAMPSFTDFYDQNYGRVVQYIYKKLGNLHDSEDLASEVFIYCYSHYDSYDPEKSSLNTWLYMIVNSRLKNHYRDTKQNIDLDSVAAFIPDTATDMDACVYMEQVSAQLMKAIDSLPERQRKIVIMSYFEEKTSAQIAETLNMTPGNVRVQLSRALDALEKLCSNILEGDR